MGGGTIPDLIGRREELDALDAAFAEASHGTPRCVLISGEAGVGKTRLLRHVVAVRAASGVRVLSGTCTELGAEGLPYGPVIEILRDQMRERGAGSLPAPLISLLPELRRERTADTDRASIAHGFLDLVARLSDREPLLIAVDDLQWADPSSRDLFGHVARSLHRGRVLLVATYRSDDLSRRDPLRPFVAELQRLTHVRHISLARFSRAETAELLVRSLPRSLAVRLVDPVYRRSAGNALFAEELARHAAAAPHGGFDTVLDPASEQTSGPVPGGLRDLLLRRVDRLPDGPRQLVRIAAVGGPTISHRLLEAVAGLAEDTLLAAIRSATDAGVLVADGTGYGFGHPLLREAVLDDLLPAERLRTHRLLAEALEAAPALTTTERFVTETAFHWYGAEQPDKAVPALLRAADTAGQMRAHAEQAQLLERALALSPVTGPASEERLDRYEAAIVAAAWGSDDARALRLIEQALREIDEGTHPMRAAALHANRAMALYNVRVDGVLPALDRAVELLPPEPGLPRARVLDLIAATLMAPGAVVGRIDQAVAAAREAAELADASGDRALHANARVTLGYARSMRGEPEGLTELAEARELAADAGAEMALARAGLYLVTALRESGQHRDAVAAAETGLAMCRAAGVIRTLGAVFAVRLAQALLDGGQLERARSVVEDSTRLDPPNGVSAVLQLTAADIALHQGRYEAAAAALAAAYPLLGDPTGITPTVITAIWLPQLEADLALHRGDAEAACRVVEAALPVVAAADGGYAWPLLLTAARAGLDGDVVDEAARRLPVSTPLWRAYAAQYRAERGTGDWGAAATAWAWLERPYEEAYAQLRQGEAALASGDRAAAVQLLGAVHERAEQLGASPLAAQARALAHSARRGPSSAGTPGAGLGLTERELVVLRLVAAGHTNRQIGEQLFISPKTVSVHVSNLMSKLQVTRRADAAATARRLGLLEDAATG